MTVERRTIKNNHESYWLKGHLRRSFVKREMTALSASMGEWGEVALFLSPFSHVNYPFSRLVIIIIIDISPFYRLHCTMTIKLYISHLTSIKK